MGHRMIFQIINVIQYDIDDYFHWSITKIPLARPYFYPCPVPSTPFWVCEFVLSRAVQLFSPSKQTSNNDVIKWKHFPRHWPFVRGIHRSPVNSPHKGQWHGALMFSLICAWINGWVNNREAGDLRRHRAHYGVIVMAWRLTHASHIWQRQSGTRYTDVTIKHIAE